jgi:transposase
VQSAHPTARGREPSAYEYKNTVYVVRDLDLGGQPSFLIFQPCFHRCSRCGHRQEHFAPFKRKKVIYTYRFEEYVLRMLIGSNEEEAAARLGISAETVELIVENQLKDDKRIDPARVIKHVGIDEISLKKRHKLYVTVMTDLTDPESPKVSSTPRRTRLRRDGNSPNSAREPNRSVWTSASSGRPTTTGRRAS